VHALDTVARSAHCIDLDGIATGTDLSRLRLAIDREGTRLVVRDSATPMFLIDLRTLLVARATGADSALGGTRQFPPPLLFAAGGAALVAAAAGVLWTRRRQRQTLIPNLDPRSEN
jgi:hypothetical protein